MLALLSMMARGGEVGGLARGEGFWCADKLARPFTAPPTPPPTRTTPVLRPAQLLSTLQKARLVMATYPHFTDLARVAALLAAEEQQVEREPQLSSGGGGGGRGGGATT